MNNRKNLFDRLDEFKKRIKIDSFTLAGVRLTFSEKERNENHFREILDRIERSDSISNEVFVVSAHNVDEIKLIDKIDSDHECEVFDNPTREPGGSGANSAYILGLLGIRTSITGAVSKDDDGDYLESSLLSAGVNTELLYKANSLPTGKTITLVEESGKRLIVVSPGINNEFHKHCEKASIIDRAKQSKIVHLSSFVGKEEVKLQEYIASEVYGKAIVSLTPGAIYSRKGLDRLTKLIQNIDIMFLYMEQLSDLVNRSSAKSFLKGNEISDYLRALYKWRSKKKYTSPLIIVVKDAYDESMQHSSKRFLAVGVGIDDLDSYMYPEELDPNIRIEMPDTTGAGDAAVAGFLTGMLNGANLESCIDSAFIMSRFASTCIGARTAFSERNPDLLGVASDIFSDERESTQTPNPYND